MNSKTRTTESTAVIGGVKVTVAEPRMIDRIQAIGDAHKWNEDQPGWVTHKAAFDLLVCVAVLVRVCTPSDEQEQLTMDAVLTADDCEVSAVIALMKKAQQ